MMLSSSFCARSFSRFRSRVYFSTMRVWESSMYSASLRLAMSSHSTTTSSRSPKVQPRSDTSIGTLRAPSPDSTSYLKARPFSIRACDPLGVEVGQAPVEPGVDVLVGAEPVEEAGVLEDDLPALEVGDRDPELERLQQVAGGTPAVNEL